MAEIVLDNVTKRYPDGALAVDKFNLDIADGEFVILVGPSGCGKSTTLNMIAGLEDISEGELRIGGQVVNNKSPKDRDIAMVFQSYALYPHMTVRENMGFALKLAKTPQNVINEKVEEAARILDLTQHLDRRPANLFVAGFIGSPAMNFLGGTLEEGKLRTGLGDLPLTGQLQELGSSARGRQMIVGIRPEDFEDASLVPSETRSNGITFQSTIDVVESLGSEKYVYFTQDVGTVDAAELTELARDAGRADSGGTGETVVARFDPATRLTEGDHAEIWVDTRRVHVFDPETGQNLTLGNSGSTTT